jgi:hypothetical protein
MPPPSLFAEPSKEKSFPTTAVAIAAAAVTILVVVLVLMARRNAPAPPPSTVQPLAAYAPNLAIGNLQMSEAGSMSGGKSIYIDGHVANKGPATVTGVTAQVIFANDQAMPPQLETVPLRVIYMRQPYVDMRPLGAAPLAPGAGADFRMIFDDINDNWNQQTPAIRIIGVSTR